MIQPSGGRAGVHGLKWLNAGYNLEQIESLRQQLLAQKDIGRVQRAMRKCGITVKRDVIQLVKQYNFDSNGIAFTEENYSAWRRLATGSGTIGDVAYMIQRHACVATNS